MPQITDIKGFAFDLDGVLADTARFHSQAWQQIALKLAIPWTERLEAGIKGIDRAASIALILNSVHRYDEFTAAEINQLMQEKNQIYNEYITTLTPKDVLPGIYQLLVELKQHGFPMSVASASRNAPAIIARLGIADFFTGIVDPAKVSAGKPAPDIFLEAAQILELQPAQVIGVEDSSAGVASIHAAGEISLGIGPEAFQAQIHFDNTAELSLTSIEAKLKSLH